MDSILRKGLFLVTLTGAIGVFPATAYASDIEDNQTMPGVGIEQVLNDCYSSQKEIQVEDYLAPEYKGEYLDMAFADVESFLYIRSEPTKQSEWVGKLYPGYAAKIVGPVGEWTKIESGSITGYVYSQYIIIGRNAQQKAEEVVEASASADQKKLFLMQNLEKKRKHVWRGGRRSGQESRGRGSGCERGCRKWSGSGGLCMSVYRQSICLGRHKPDKWS